MAIHWPPYPHDLIFASHFVYPTGPKNADAERAKAFILAVKQDAIRDGKHLVDIAIERVVAEYGSTGCCYKGWFGDDVALVPLPGHGKMLRHAVSSARLLCLAMERRGLGNMVACMERLEAVQKSAYAAPGERPGPQQHYETIRVHPSLHASRAIVLVDDVITRGATMIGAAARVAEAYPGVSIRGFGISRTASFPSGSRIEQPVIGKITARHGVPLRSP